MFKYTAKNPESAFSVLAASFRLYFASFLYSLTLSIVASLTFWTTNYFIHTYFEMDEVYSQFIPGSVSSLLSLIFFIPLIKRIYSVGAGLPITTHEAFRGFFIHFIRLTLFAVLTLAVASIIPLIWDLAGPKTYSTSILIPAAIISFVYIYIGLKIYFAPLFIVLENKSILDATKASLRIERQHVWMTFCILVTYIFGYWTVISFTSGYFVWDPLGIDLYMLIFSVITLPLFFSIQICQFFNLKRLAK